MLAAYDNPDLRKWLVRCKNFNDLRKWCRRVITEFRDNDMHWVIALARLEGERNRKFHHAIRNLVLPVEDLFPGDSSAQARITKLRNLFRQIRLLCMATLDSYYSHQPMEIQLNSAILGLAEYTTNFGLEGGLDRILNEVNGWLAEELYLHPRSCATLTDYENQKAEIILARFKKTFSEAQRKGFLLGLLHGGQGIPEIDQLKPLLRMKFRDSIGLADSGLLQLSRGLQSAIASPPATLIGLNRNPFRKETYLDVFYRPSALDNRKISSVYKNLLDWLMNLLSRRVEAQASRLVPNPPTTGTPKNRYDNLKSVMRVREIELQLQNIHNIFMSFVDFVLPEGYKAVITEFVPDANRKMPILVKLSESGNVVFDQVSPHFSKILFGKGTSLVKSHRQEITAVYNLVRRSQAKFLLVCTDKFVIKDSFKQNDYADEWDGVIFEIYDSECRFTIIEAKTSGTPRGRENSAFKQLDGTRKLLALKGITYKRQKIKGKGAYLRYTLPIE